MEASNPNSGALSFKTTSSLPPSPAWPTPLPCTHHAFSMPQTYHPDDYNPYYTPQNPQIPHALCSKPSVLATNTLERSVFDTSDTESLAPKASKEYTSTLICLLKIRIYIRVLAVIVMLISLGLIASGIAAYETAKRDPSHPLDRIPEQAQIIDRPCIVFSGIASMNLVLSGTVLAASWWASKASKSTALVTAIFTILSIIGFSSSMAACFFLDQQMTLHPNLWKWSCTTHAHGITTPALDFGHVCSVISYSWKFGLVQASLELLTFVLSVLTFVLLKYALFVRHGLFGKVF